MYPNTVKSVESELDKSSLLDLLTEFDPKHPLPLDLYHLFPCFPGLLIHFGAVVQSCEIHPHSFLSESFAFPNKYQENLCWKVLYILFITNTLSGTVSGALMRAVWIQKWEFSRSHGHWDCLDVICHHSYWILLVGAPVLGEREPLGSVNAFLKRLH